MPFHAKEGWCFQRLDNGWVRMTFSGTLNAQVDFDPNIWASIIASMSARGETRETFDAALAFHGEP